MGIKDRTCTRFYGNLLPQEKAKIIFSYAILYRWTGDQLRFFLPTTVAPRYGESDHQPHQMPQSSLTVENQFSLRLEIYGALREAQFRCPSHEVDLAKSEDKIVISLQQTKVVMDRDFILSVKAPQATRSFALCGADGEGVAAIASFQPFFPGLQQPRPLNLAIVIDCSGSMQGDSIDQAKQALDGILDGLQPQDHITMIAFGNTTNRLFDRLLPCNKTNIAKAKRFAKQLSANMGGTEIGKALNDTYSAISTESADTGIAAGQIARVSQAPVVPAHMRTSAVAAECFFERRTSAMTRAFGSPKMSVVSEFDVRSFMYLDGRSVRDWK